MTSPMSPELLAHYQSGHTTIATGLRIERADGEVFAFTSADHSATIEGVRHLAGPGLDISALSTQAGTSVDNLELTVFPDEELLTRPSFLAGLWAGARFTLFEYNWADLTMGVHTLKRGWLGQPKINQGAFTIELRSLRQALQQQIGAYTTQTCRARLGDARCGVDLAPLTHATTVTAVADLYNLTGNAVQADDYYAEGSIAFTSGGNQGVARKVKAYTSGAFVLALPLPFPPEVGDNFTAIAGCRKRLNDCRDTFSNVLNFQGEPHSPGIDALTAYPTPGSDAE